MNVLFWILGILSATYIYYKIDMGLIGLIIGLIVSFLIQLILTKIFVRKKGVDQAIEMMENTNKFTDKVFRKATKEFVENFFMIYDEMKNTNKFETQTDLHINVLFDEPDSIKEGEGKETILKTCSTVEGACYFGMLYIKEHIKHLSAYRARQLIEYIDNEVYKRDIKKQSFDQKAEILKMLNLDSVEL